MAAAPGSGRGSLLTASEIAELAGVSASAVSNWRKRFVDFPASAGTAPTGGDLFLAVDVDRWLRLTNRMPKEARTARLWEAADQLRGKRLLTDLLGLVATAAVFVHLARTTTKSPSKQLRGDARELADAVRTLALELDQSMPLNGFFAPLMEIEPEALQLLIQTADEAATAGDLALAVDEAVARGIRYGEFRTPAPVTDLVIQLSEPSGAVLDPAAGSAEFLIRAASVNAGVEVYGQELSPETWRLAVSRLLLRDIAPRIALGDSLAEDAYPDRLFDLVLCDPPAGARMSDARTSPGDPKWRLLGSFDAPSSKAADFAWLAHAISHLAQNGRAYVLLPPGALFRGGAEARMRAELIRQGTVEAVIALPAGAGQNTLASSTIWVMREPTPNPKPVLLVDAQHETASMTPRLRTQIADTLHAWRSEPDSFKATADFAIAVPVLELIGGDASLLPSRWVYEPTQNDLDATLDTVATTQRALGAARAIAPTQTPTITMQPVAPPVERGRVRDFIDRGLMWMIRPARIKTEQYLDEGPVPVWLPADIRPQWEREEAPRFVDFAQVEPKSVTQPGDVVITTIGGLRARVDTDGGHLLGTSLHALRLDADWFDPHCVAALLLSERNRRAMGGATIPRVNVLELEIPLIGADEAARLRDLLEALALEAEAAHKVAAAAEAVREAMIEAISTGAATIADGRTAARRNSP